MSNEVGLKYYPATHRYRLDGRWIPGVTTILGVLDKPALKKWAAAQVAEYVTYNPEAVEALRTLGPKPMVYALKEIPWQKRDTAATRGNVLHDHAEQILRGETVEVDEEDVDVVNSAVEFMTDWDIRPLLIETPVVSRAGQWAGTLDLIANYTHPRTGQTGCAVFDWKSGKALYPEYAWQLNAYAHAEFAMVDDWQEAPIPACDAAFGVQISDDGYTVAPFKFGPDIYAEFLAIRAVYTIVKAGRGDWKKPGSGHVGLPIEALQEAM